MKHSVRAISIILFCLYLSGCDIDEEPFQNKINKSDEKTNQARMVGIGYQCWFPPQRWKNAWDEPELGFYRSDDKKVIRQHAKWLYDAGVDFIWIDWSNNIGNRIEGQKRADLEKIENATRILFDEYVKLAKRPKISIFLGIDGNPDYVHNGLLQKKADQVYEQYIWPPEYRDLIFHYQGKPLLVVYVWTPSPFPEGLPQWNDNRFTVKWMTGFLSNQPNLIDQNYISKYGYWSWWDRDPQAYSMYNGKPETMIVSAAYPGAKGWDDAGDISRRGRLGGHTFLDQFERARDIDVQMVLINSWNEWVPTEEISPEFSNDIEPSKTLGRFYLNLMKQEIAIFKENKTNISYKENTNEN